MSRQRWGTFSVADHLRTRAFVTEVFLYDRLVIPYPPDSAERKRWTKNRWAPGLLDKCMDILEKGKLLEAVPWTQSRQQLFQDHYQLTQVVSRDALWSTREVLAMDKIIPDSVWPIIAYPSRRQFAKEFRLKNSQFDEDYRRARTEKLGWLLGHHFLVPDTEVRNDLYLLQEAVNLAKTEEFQEYRVQLYQWQDTIITDNISDEEALRQMQDYLERYNTLVRARGLKSTEKFIYTVVASGVLSVAPLLQPALALLSVVGGIFLGYHNFKKFDQEPETPHRYEVAAMFHDVQKHFGWR